MTIFVPRKSVGVRHLYVLLIFGKTGDVVTSLGSAWPPVGKLRSLVAYFYLYCSVKI